jgi:cellulose synthase/poly-beta-1,6-N-acetylglucosamine synthase-like glycosyltransferase
LGGNTVFFKRNWLNIADGWDENCLTEDAEIGIRLSLLGAKMAIVYDENHATQEETPVSTEAFIKQRTRWNQGYMQILMKGDWLKLPTLKQRLLAGYLLILPELLTIMSVLSLVMTLAVSSIEMGMEIAMFSFLPMAILVVQIAVYMAALWQFSRDYKKTFRLWMWPKLALTFIPYLGVLVLGSIRAVWRFANKNLAWEKTLHLNAHRIEGVTYQNKDYAMV